MGIHKKQTLGRVPEEKKNAFSLHCLPGVKGKLIPY